MLILSPASDDETELMIQPNRPAAGLGGAPGWRSRESVVNSSRRSSPRAFRNAQCVVVLESAEAPGQIPQNEACKTGEPKAEDVGVPFRREAVHVLRVFVVSPQKQCAKENAVGSAPPQEQLCQFHGEADLLAVSPERD